MQPAGGTDGAAVTGAPTEKLPPEAPSASGNRLGVVRLTRPPRHDVGEPRVFVHYS